MSAGGGAMVCKLVCFHRYIDTLHKLLEYLSMLHMLPQRPAAIVIEDLDTYMCVMGTCV